MVLMTRNKLWGWTRKGWNIVQLRRYAACGVRGVIPTAWNKSPRRQSEEWNLGKRGGRRNVVQKIYEACTILHEFSDSQISVLGRLS